MVIFFGLIWYFGALGIDNFFLAEFYGGVFMCLFPKKIVRFMGLLEIGLVVGFVCLFFFFWGGGGGNQIGEEHEENVSLFFQKNSENKLNFFFN